MLTGCGSADNASPATTNANATSALAPPSPSTTIQAVTTTTVSPTQVRLVEVSEADTLLPDLSVTTSSATHVVELQNRTLTVSATGSMLCVGGGDLGLQPDTCADVTAGPGLLTYTDDADTPVFAVLTADEVSVDFPATNGVELVCFNEPISSVGPLVLRWCENDLPAVIRFVVANGPPLEVAFG